MKKRRSKKTPDTLSEELHEAVEIIEQLPDESENPNDDEQTELESEDNYGIEFDEDGMYADPTPEFWEAWQEDKEKIKERGWWVVKEKNPASPLWGKWLIFETQKHLKSYNNRQKQRAKVRVRRAHYTLSYDMIGNDGEDEYMWRELSQVLEKYREKSILLKYMYDFEGAGDVTDEYE